MTWQEPPRPTFGYNDCRQCGGKGWFTYGGTMFEADTICDVCAQQCIKERNDLQSEVDACHGIMD